jgi:hypothetical protein
MYARLLKLLWNAWTSFLNATSLSFANPVARSLSVPTGPVFSPSPHTYFSDNFKSNTERAVFATRRSKIWAA